MKNILVTICLIIGLNISAYSQPVQASEASNGPIKVYSTNAYYVNAQNNSGDSYLFSFNYEIVTYRVTHQAWSKFPVYEQLSISSESYTNVSINPNEQRSIFTAPVNSDNSIVNYVRIIDVFDVHKQ